MKASVVTADRRAFLIRSASIAGALSLGFRIPFEADAALAAEAKTAAETPEINAWVVVKPDDSVLIRIARSEMGQGSLTGLAQLVAEELDCDWAKVSTGVAPVTPDTGRCLTELASA
jgi:isoquinoline 1-oxidoreductase beta subunit